MESWVILAKYLSSELHLKTGHTGGFSEWNALFLAPVLVPVDYGTGVLRHVDRARAESDKVVLAGGELDELNSWVRKL